MTKSAGITMLTRSGSIVTDADASTTSVTVFIATHRPDQRDIAQPCSPRSRYSCTVAG